VLISCIFDVGSYSFEAFHKLLCVKTETNSESVGMAEYTLSVQHVNSDRLRGF